MRKQVKSFIMIFCFTICITSIFALTGCKKDEGYKKNKDLDTSKEITLTLASGTDTWIEMENVISKFEAIYENCTINYEYIESYSNVLANRLALDTDKIDIFKTFNVLSTTPYKDYCYNLISDTAKEYLDLSDNHDGLVKNFQYIGEENTQYAIPYGGEMRGLYVNTTLLNKYDLDIPTNREEFLNCCEVLYSNGLLPIQSSVGTFAQQLLYPYICNTIVNTGKYEEMYTAIDNLDEGITDYFADAFAFLYEIVSKGYYDYKRTEDEGKFSFTTNDVKSKDFLNILEVSEGVYEKQDDIGEIAFLTDTQAFKLYLDKTKSDYHSEIEYEFITAPVGEDGGYAYLSPADGLAINKSSDNIEWSLEFLNFFFNKEINTDFAKESGKIPNTKDALIEYNIDEDHACDVGQVTWTKFNFYKLITPLLISNYKFEEESGTVDVPSISKMTNPKYMNESNGTYSIKYTLEEYLAYQERIFQLTKESLAS